MDKITQFSQKIEKTANFMNFHYFIEEKIFFNENSNCCFSANYSPKGTREHALESSRKIFFNFKNFIKKSCFPPHLKGMYCVMEESILSEKIEISDKKSPKQNFTKMRFYRRKSLQKTMLLRFKIL